MEEEGLPHDLVMEILARHPLENLVRFRGVCKLWFATITDSKFMAKHQQHNLDSNGLIINLFGPSVSGPSPQPATLHFQIFPDCIKPRPFFRIIEAVHNVPISRCRDTYCRVTGTCNGYFCAVRRSRTDSESPPTIFLCNPITGSATVIPDSCSAQPNLPEMVKPQFGVGFDSVERDYKILKMTMTGNPDDHHHGEVSIFSLKSRAWKKVDSPIPFLDAEGKSIFLHGSIHWLTSDSYTSDIMKIRRVLLFDVHNEVFKEMPLPRMHNIDTVSIHVVRGWLSAMMFESHVYQLTYQVWIMEKYGVEESWMRQFEVVFPPGIQRCIEVTFGGQMVICSYNRVADRDGELVNNVSISGHSLLQMILLDPQTDQFSNLCPVSSCNDFQIFSIQGSLDLIPIS